MRQGYSHSARINLPEKPPIGFDFEDDELEAAAKEIGPMCDKQRKRSFAWYYDLGTKALEHYCRVEEEREQHGGSMYGEHFYLRLAECLNRPGISPALLSDCATLVRNISADEYAELSKYPEMSPTHARILGRIEVKKDRDIFKAMVINDKLTTEKLNAAIVEHYGCRRAAGGGRKPMVSKDVQAALTHLARQAEKHCSLNENWFGDRFDIRSKIAELPIDKVNEKLKDQVEDALNHCRRLKEMAIADEEHLSTILSEVTRRIAAQAEVSARVAAEEKELEEEEHAVRAAGRARTTNSSSNLIAQQDRRIGRELRA